MNYKSESEQAEAEIEIEIEIEVGVVVGKTCVGSSDWTSRRWWSKLRVAKQRSRLEK